MRPVVGGDADGVMRTRERQERVKRGCEARAYTVGSVGAPAVTSHAGEQQSHNSMSKGVRISLRN